MNVYDVDIWLHEVCHVVERFYPTAVSKATGLPLEDVFRRLISLSHVGYVEVAYEARCGSCGATLTIQRTLDPTVLYDAEGLCSVCGSEQDIVADNVFPLFYVNDEWRNQAKKAQAVSGPVALPAGGEPISVGRLTDERNITWADTVLSPEEIDVLTKIAVKHGIVEKLLDSLERIPTTGDERKSRLQQVRDYCETIIVMFTAGGLVGKWIEPAKNVISKLLDLLCGQ